MLNEELKEITEQNGKDDVGKTGGVFKSQSKTYDFVLTVGGAVV